MNKEKNFVSAVVYVHNAEKKIQDFLNNLIDVLEENFEHSEIICVNDCSDDNSADCIKELVQRTNNTTITILNMSYYHGLELAMNAGVDLSIGDFVFEFDSTLVDYEKDQIIKVYKRSLEGYDIVSASPDGKQKFTSRFFYYIFDKFANSRGKMYTERFRILSRRVINRISSMNKTVPYRKVLYANCGLKVDNLVYEVVAKVRDKQEKREKKYRRHLAVDTLILFTEMGYKFSITMTVAMMLVAVFMIVYSIATYLFSNPVEGWTTTILFLSAAFFGLFGILTVIIRYLQILVDLVFKRKRYSFESIEKLTK